MTKKNSEDEPLRVVDKRRFTTGGELRPEADRPEPSPPKASAEPLAEVPPQPPPPPPKATPAPESKQAQTARQAYEQQAGSGGGSQIDFETVILSISTSAMFQLGLVQDQGGHNIPPDPEAARHTIDMLGVLQQKTQGNLAPSEQKLLDQVLYELRMAYVQIASGHPPKPPTPPAGR
jgi:hypothetical protein